MQLALRTARTFWLKKNVMWSAVRPAPAAAGDSLKVSRFLPTRQKTKQHHNPASHHECKNTRHREAAPTCTYRRTLGPSLSITKLNEKVMKKLLIVALLPWLLGCNPKENKSVVVGIYSDNLQVFKIEPNFVMPFTPFNYDSLDLNDDNEYDIFFNKSFSPLSSSVIPATYLVSRHI